MTKEEAKRFAEVLLAYSRGEPVQVRDGAEWVTRTDCKLFFNSKAENYRLPPPKVSYRLWLHRSNVGVASVCLTHGRAILDCEAFAKHTPGFVRWLGDWQEVEA